MILVGDTLVARSICGGDAAKKSFVRRSFIIWWTTTRATGGHTGHALGVIGDIHLQVPQASHVLSVCFRHINYRKILIIMQQRWPCPRAHLAFILSKRILDSFLSRPWLWLLPQAGWKDQIRLMNDDARPRLNQSSTSADGIRNTYLPMPTYRATPLLLRPLLALRKAIEEFRKIICPKRSGYQIVRGCLDPEGTIQGYGTWR